VEEDLHYLQCITSGTSGHLSRTTNVLKLAGYLPHIKNPMSLEGFKPTNVRGKWFAVNYHLTTFFK
jgi:hypothetical protein